MTTRPPTPRLRLDADARREQILVAAQRLFAGRSFDAVSTSELAAAAGTTRTNLHYYFGTKRALYLEVVRRFARLPPPPHTPAPPEEDRVRVVRRLFSRWLELVEENVETYISMLGTGGLMADPEVQAILHDSVRAWEDRLLGVLGLPDTPPNRATVRVFQALVTSATDEWLRSGTLTRPEVEDLLCRSLFALSPDRRDLLLTGCQ